MLLQFLSKPLEAGIWGIVSGSALLIGTMLAYFTKVSVTLTYVVVKIWDQRRLIVPISYFIEKPFENWTRVSSDILGTVFLYTDYAIPIDELRGELTRILKKEGEALWDKEVGMLQVTNTTEKGVELRILVSSKDAGMNWDLRCLVREQMINFIHTRYPASLPKIRFEQAAEKIIN